MATSNELAEAYQHCGRLTKSAATSFYYAFKTLPHDKREAIYAAYAFCRICDDIADEEMPLIEKQRLLRELRASLPSEPKEPIIVAIADTTNKYDIPRNLFEQVIDGVEMDLNIYEYETYDDLRKYCYLVASVPGLICLEIFGYNDHPKAREYAIDLGYAMQLTNILRDVKEDADLGRIYIPRAELRRFGYREEDLISGIVNEAFRNLIKFQIERARYYFTSGLNLLPLLEQDARTCPAVLIEVYSSILDRIEKCDYDVFSRRISLTTWEKLIIVLRLWIPNVGPQLLGWLRLS